MMICNFIALHMHHGCVEEKKIVERLHEMGKRKNNKIMMKGKGP